MSTDSFRIEANLIARNQAQAAAHRAPDSGFSNLLEQAARSLSQEGRSSEAGTPTPDDSVDSPASRERATQARQHGERARTTNAEREPEGRGDSEPNEGESRPADRAKASGAQDNGGPIQDRKAAELKRLLRQIQDSKTAPRTSDAANPSIPGNEDPAARQIQGESGRSQPQRMAANPDATPSDRQGAALPMGDGAGPAQPTGTPVTTQAGHHSETGPRAGRPSEQQAGEPTQATLLGLQGLIKGNGRPEGPQETRTTPGGASNASPSSAAGRASASTHPQGPDLTAAFAASLQRTPELLPGLESTQALLAQASGHGKATLIEATATGAAPAGLIAGALGAGLSPASGPNPSATPGAQPGAIQWSLPYAPGEARFGEALGERLNWMIRDGLQQAEITLNPRELGPIRIALSMEGDAAQLGIQADHAFTRQTIEDALPRLKALLAEQGVQLGQTQIDSGSGREQGSADRQTGDQRPAHRRDTSVAAERDSVAAREGAVRTGQMSLRSPATGRVDVFA